MPPPLFHPPSFVKLTLKSYNKDGFIRKIKIIKTEMIKEIKNGEITWINITNPGKNALRFLKNHYQIAPRVLKEFIPAIKRSKVED